jgi:hypothetical protein
MYQTARYLKPEDNTTKLHRFEGLKSFAILKSCLIYAVHLTITIFSFVHRPVFLKTLRFGDWILSPWHLLGQKRRIV